MNKIQDALLNYKWHKNLKQIEMNLIEKLKNGHKNMLLLKYNKYGEIKIIIKLKIFIKNIGF